MDPRLEEASYQGNLDALHQLLREDSLLLDHLRATTPCIANNPLHIAALLGHADFAREVLRLKPQLARDLNGQGHTPLHLASASGQVSVVRELINVIGSYGLCCLRDRDGLMPIHTAAAKGRVQILAMLIEACPKSAQELTYHGETVVHLAVKSGCYEVVEFLVERMGDQEISLLNSKDDSGNTILHLAAARRQYQTVKLLLRKPGIHVNAVNVKGLTVLDVLLRSPNEYNEQTLEEMIRAAGGKTSSEEGSQQPALSSTVDPPVTNRQTKFQYFIQKLQQIMKCLELTPSTHRPFPDDDKTNTSGTLMVVATLIATITFQPVLNPPGGFNSGTGVATRSDLRVFLVLDMVGLFAALSIILILVCVEPRSQRKITRTLVWVMWVAVYSTGLAFAVAACIVFPDSEAVNSIVIVWDILLVIPMLWVYLRFTIYLLNQVGWWMEKFGGKSKSTFTGYDLLMKRTLVLFLITAIPCGLIFVGSLNSFLTPPHWSCYIFRPLIVLDLPGLYLCSRFIFYLFKKAGWRTNGEIEILQTGLYIFVKRTLIVLLMVVILSFAIFQIYFFTIAIWGHQYIIGRTYCSK